MPFSVALSGATVAVSLSVSPTLRVCVAGATVIDDTFTTGGVAGATVRVQVAVLVASAVLVAVIVVVPGATAVTTPVVASMVAIAALPVDHTTLCARLPTTSTEA